jgi:hypothetical protein
MVIITLKVNLQFITFDFGPNGSKFFESSFNGPILIIDVVILYLCGFMECFKLKSYY